MGKNNIRLNNITFLEKVNFIHNNKYEYIDLNYINNKSYIIIYCKEHNYYFKQRADMHLGGQKCKYCTKEISKIKNKKYKEYKQKISNDIWISKMNDIHNNYYDYSLNILPMKSKSIIQIICPKHGVFLQKISEHLYLKNGCYKCGREKIQNFFKSSNEKWKKQANIIHDYFYNYDNFVYVNTMTESFVTCPIHGDFKVKMNHHICNKSGCPKCNISKGENIIENWLKQNNIIFETEKTFSNCMYKKLLRFDFYLNDYNICIEYNGIQHFKAIEYFGGDKTLFEQQKKDIIKEKYCNDNNIKLFKINYDEDIIDKLNNLFKN